MASAALADPQQQLWLVHSPTTHLCHMGHAHPQALRALIKSKTAAELQLAMPPWVYLYSKLCMDTNRGVRTEAAGAQGEFAAALGKALAPHLKSVMGPWWLAQFDAHPEASVAARSAFQVVTGQLPACACLSSCFLSCTHCSWWPSDCPTP